jgi:predicted TPR repeat methyltransferase
MLAVARAKRCYDELVVADLNRGPRAPPPGGPYDLAVGSGLFMPGHCGPAAFEAILRALNAGGHAVFTVRSTLYAARRDQFAAAVAAAGAELLSDDLWPYYGEIRANVLAVRKV